MASRLTTARPVWRGQLSVKLAERRSFSVSANTRASWGFIGLGQMGYQMAKNLHAKIPVDDTLYVHDIVPEAVTRFQQEIQALGQSSARVEITSRVRDISENANTIITVLPEPSHVKNVFSQLLQPENSTQTPGEEKLFIDCSTIDPTSSREVARAVLTTQQGRFVDAPMSGGVVGAKAGTLTFMVGAQASLMERLEPILLMMGKRVLHCGEQGNGLAGKLANNYLLAINNIATAEAMNLGIKSGLDAKVLANLINVSTGRCWPSEVNNPVNGVIDGAPAERDYLGGFGISLMRKDLNLALTAAQESGATLELGDRAKEVYEAAEQENSCKNRDFSVVYRFIGGEAK